MEQYQITTNEGTVEVVVQDNGVRVGALVSPSEEYLQWQASHPTSPTLPAVTDVLGQQLVEKDLQILELQQDNQTLGQQAVDLDLRLLQGGL